MRVAIEPCPIDWDELTPVEGGRHCDRCRKTVIDLSARTERQARRVLASEPSLCVSVRREEDGRPIFRASRTRRLAAGVAVLLGLSAHPAEAADVDVDVRKGTHPPQEQPVDFGMLQSKPVRPCHPGRFPHGPSGSAWVSVGKGVSAVWRRMVLTCREGRRVVLRDRQDFPENGRHRFDHLPEDLDCELKLRGGEPKKKLLIHTHAEEP